MNFDWSMFASVLNFAWLDSWKNFLFSHIFEISLLIRYRISSYSFLNIEIVANSNSCRTISIFLPIKLNFCCGNYSREETIEERKLCEEIQ